jgi:uncharacterized protein YbjT (DUF2867 family)
MKVLVLGANGFLGSNIVGKLINSGHDVICGARKIDTVSSRFPDCTAVALDFRTLHDPADWATILKKYHVDVVVNAVGALLDKHANPINDLHVKGPSALFDACTVEKVRVIHISAFGIQAEKNTDYAKTKKITIEFLEKNAKLHWNIVSASVVYGDASSGVTSTLRALAATPFCIPLIDKGRSVLYPIHLDDFTDIIVKLVENPKLKNLHVSALGPDAISLKKLLMDFRAWLGLKPGFSLSLSKKWLWPLGLIGDLIGSEKLNTTSLRLLSVPTPKRENQTTLPENLGVEPKSWRLGLFGHPAGIQSFWYARLFTLKTGILALLGIFWISKGLIAGFINPAQTLDLLKQIDLFGPSSIWYIKFFCIIEIVLGTCYLFGRAIPLSTYILLSFLITDLCLFRQLHFWIDPMGGMIKIFPLIGLHLVVLSINKNRL